jgi:hypothetical protein
MREFSGPGGAYLELKQSVLVGIDLERNFGGQIEMPLDISSRSQSVSANRERRQGDGRIPPCGETWK